MKPRFLWLVPVGLAGAMLLIAGGPYTDIASSLNSESLAPFEESAAIGIADVATRLAVLPGAQRAAYAGWQWTDIGVALANTLTAIVLLLVPARGVGIPKAGRWLLVGFASLLLIAELLEGNAIRSAIGAYPDLTQSAASQLAFATTMKWWALSACAVAVLLLWLGWAVTALVRGFKTN